MRSELQPRLNILQESSQTQRRLPTRQELWQNVKATAIEAGPAFLVGMGSRIGMLELMQQGLQQDMISPTEAGIMFFGISAMSNYISASVRETQRIQKLGLKGYHDVHAQAISETPSNPVIEAVKELTYGNEYEARAVVKAYAMDDRRARFEATKEQLRTRTTPEAQLEHYRSQVVTELTKSNQWRKKTSFSDKEINAQILKKIRNEIADVSILQTMTPDDRAVQLESREIKRRLQSTAQAIAPNTLNNKVLNKDYQNKQEDILFNAVLGLQWKKFIKHGMRYVTGFAVGEILREPTLKLIEKGQSAWLWMKYLPESEPVQSLQKQLAELGESARNWWEHTAKPAIMPGRFKQLHAAVVDRNQTGSTETNSVLPFATHGPVEQATATATATATTTPSPTPEPTQTPEPTRTPTPEPEIIAPPIDVPPAIDFETDAAAVRPQNDYVVYTTAEPSDTPVRPQEFIGFRYFDHNYTPAPGEIIVYNDGQLTGTPGERIALWMCTDARDENGNLGPIRTLIVFEAPSQEGVTPIIDDNPTLFIGHSFGEIEYLNAEDKIWNYDLMEPYRRFAEAEFINHQAEQNVWVPMPEYIEFKLEKNGVTLTYRALKTIMIDTDQMGNPNVLYNTIEKLRD